MEKSVKTTAFVMFLFAITSTMVFGFAVEDKPADKPAPEKAVSPEKAPAPKPAGTIGAKAALLEGLDFIKGKPVNIKEGSVYVVEFWATWCGPCRTTIPHLTKVQKEYKDKGVKVIGISSEKDIEKVKSFVEKQAEKMDYTVAVDPERKVNDGYMKAYSQRGIPTAFIVNKKGNVVWVGHPMGDMDEVLKQVVEDKFDYVAYQKAKDAREAAAKARQNLLSEYFKAVLADAPKEKTRKTADKILKLDDPDIAVQLAQYILLARQFKDSQRDYEVALKAASFANKKKEGKDPAVLFIFGVAQSKADKLQDAVATIQKAIDLAEGNERLQQFMIKQLETIKTEMASEE